MIHAPASRLAAALLTLPIAPSGCGYSAQNSEARGQVKNVTTATSVLCGAYYVADMAPRPAPRSFGSLSVTQICCPR